MRDLLRGAGAGALATVPMTAAMIALHRRLPERERYPLPPREIAEVVTEAAAPEVARSPEAVQGLTLAAHVGYGTLTGAIYGAFARQPSAATGVAFGLAVWAVSYLGWLPALGILRPATRHPPRRTALMIAAHVVWGAALGATAGALSPSRATATGTAGRGSARPARGDRRYAACR